MLGPGISDQDEVAGLDYPFGWSLTDLTGDLFLFFDTVLGFGDTRAVGTLVGIFRQCNIS